MSNCTQELWSRKAARMLRCNHRGYSTSGGFTKPHRLRFPLLHITSYYIILHPINHITSCSSSPFPLGQTSSLILASFFFWGNYSRKHSSHPYFMKIWRIWWGFHKDFHPSPCKTVGFLRPWPRTVGARTSPGEAIWRSWPVGRRWEWKVARFLEILGDDWMISMEMCGEFFFCIFDHFCTTSSDNHQIYTCIYIYILCIYIYTHTPVYSYEMTCIVFILQ